MKIRDKEILGFAALAPMAGVADRAMREICEKYGAAYAVGELTSAKALSLGDKKSAQFLERGNLTVFANQLFGGEPSSMAEAAKIAESFAPDFIDINMGCPAPKVANNGGGSSLMKDPVLAGKIVRAVKDATSLPVTVKIRMGWDFDNINAVEMAKRAENAGASAVTVHGRTRNQMYAPPVNRDIIAQGKKEISIPVIGNGDIIDEQSAAIMLEETNCDLIMVGRGALGRPWVFSQINAYLEHGRVIPEPPVAEKMRVMIKHIETLCQYKGDYVGMREARKHAGWYTKGLRGAANYRRELGTLENMEQLQEIAYKICVENQ